VIRSHSVLAIAWTEDGSAAAIWRHTCLALSLAATGFVAASLHSDRIAFFAAVGSAEWL